MARHKEFVPEDVLERAMVTFWRFGYASASTSQLAAEMGLGKRSMYDTFGDKHALYLASLRRYITQVENMKDEGVRRASTLQGALRELLGPPRFDGEVPAGCFAVLAAADAAVGDSEVRGVVSAYFGRSEDRVRAQVRRFRGPVPDEAGPVVRLACDAALGYRLRARSGHADPRQIDHLVAMVCDQL